MVHTTVYTDDLSDENTALDLSVRVVSFEDENAASISLVRYVIVQNKHVVL